FNLQVLAASLAFCWLAALRASAATSAVVSAGLGGQPPYAAKFREHATTVATAAEQAAGTRSNVVSLTGADAKAANIRRQAQSLAGRMKPEGSAVVGLDGHRSYDRETYHLHPPGPVLTDGELARLFDSLPARDQLIINATSASGAVIERWQNPRRVVITATKSGGERTATRFAQYWAQAVAS